LKVSRAKTILNKNGVVWFNMFDLNIVIDNAKGNERIVNACKRVKEYILRGK